MRVASQAFERKHAHVSKWKKHTLTDGTDFGYCDNSVREKDWRCREGCRQYERAAGL